MHPRVSIDFDRIRDNARDIARRTRVTLMAVVKANAYGLGARSVVEAIDDVVDGYYVFHTHEAIEADLRNITSKPILAAIGPEVSDHAALSRCAELSIRLGCWSIEQARAHLEAGVESVLSVDTGMQRFACPIEQIESILKTMPIKEAFTHAARPEQAMKLRSIFEDRGLALHAAASALMDDPRCWLDAVRPGLALYHDAVTVTAPLIDARDASQPIGYTQFNAQRFGVIFAGYSQGLRKGPVLLNGRIQQILEVGMQSAYVSIDPLDAAGDQVTLVGPGLSPHTVAQAWSSTPHEVILRMSAMRR